MAVGTNRDINGNFYYCCRMFTDFLLSCNGKEDDVCLEYIYFVVFYIYDWYFVAGITFPICKLLRHLVPAKEVRN